MGEPVKRTYDNSRRRSQVRATRGEVVKAAHALFVARGYAATTVDAIADAAGVPQATVYRHFGGKRGILTAVLDVAFGGDDEPVEYQHRPEVRAALSDPDPAGMLDAFARMHPDVVARSAPIQHVLGEAAAADHEAAELLALARNQRHTGQSRIARLLAERGVLAEGLNEERPPMSSTRCSPRRCIESSSSNAAGNPSATGSGSRKHFVRRCFPKAREMSHQVIAADHLSMATISLEK